MRCVYASFSRFHCHKIDARSNSISRPVRFALCQVHSLCEKVLCVDCRNCMRFHLFGKSAGTVGARPGDFNDYATVCTKVKSFDGVWERVWRVKVKIDYEKLCSACALRLTHSALTLFPVFDDAGHGFSVARQMCPRWVRHEKNTVKQRISYNVWNVQHQISVWFIFISIMAIEFSSTRTQADWLNPILQNIRTSLGLAAPLAGQNSSKFVRCSNEIPINHEPVYGETVQIVPASMLLPSVHRVNCDGQKIWIDFTNR